MDADKPGIDYAAVLADLKAKRADLDAAIAGIERMIGVAPSFANVIFGEVNTSSDVQSDSFFGMSIADASKKFLGMKRKPQTTQDIADALEAGGMTHTSGNWGNTVGSVLNRIDASGGDIVRVKRGTWGLASWYPGRKRQAADKSKESEGESSTEATGTAETGDS